LSGQDPVRTKLLAEAQLGGMCTRGSRRWCGNTTRNSGSIAVVAAIVTYLGKTAQLDFNYSISNYPRTVRDLIAEAIPWTLGLLGMTTLLSFGIGTFLGALLAWPGAPRWMRYVMPPLWHCTQSRSFCSPDPDDLLAFQLRSAANLRWLFSGLPLRD